MITFRDRPDHRYRIENVVIEGKVVGWNVGNAQLLLQQQLGITHIPSNDFSLYDHVLDTIAMVGAVPERYHWGGSQVDLHTYFAMARGVQEQESAIPAMEMTKWFDTNYHYIVPEFELEQRFHLA